MGLRGASPQPTMGDTADSRHAAVAKLRAQEEALRSVQAARARLGRLVDRTTAALHSSSAEEVEPATNGSDLLFLELYMQPRRAITLAVPGKTASGLPTRIDFR